MKICEKCGKEHVGLFGSGRFCSISCANSRKFNDITIKKISTAVKNKRKGGNYINVNWHEIGIKSTKGKYKNPKNLFDISHRTRSKIIFRLRNENKICCCICGWNKGTGDLHHINGKKIKDYNEHINVSYLCPNCHRLIHEHKINKNLLVNLNKQIGDLWKSFYFG